MPEILFEEFYQEAWHRPPHRWQCRLAHQVLADRKWPDVIDLPTGAGKTSALDVAVYCLALEPCVFPRRVVFVVDRRVVVDQTAGHARALARTLRGSLDAAGPSPLRSVAERLSAHTGGGEPLDVDGLRGGDRGDAVVGGEWARRPDQPAVIVSTVDQFGSRLLFDGYGVSPSMKPVHAGLTGNDCLVLLDEVQLSTAFAETLRYLQEEAHGVRGPCPSRWQVVQMSATPVGDQGRRFALVPEEKNDGSELAKRVSAPKRARLVPIGTKRQTAREAWSAALPGLLKKLPVTDGTVGVVVNRVATASEIGRVLDELGEQSVVLTGRMRAQERCENEKLAFDWADPAATRRAGRRFVVATQCIEVGADLSFDALITEVCPLSSLRQRFGRLDRRGLVAASGAVAGALVVGVRAELEGRSPDPVYGGALRATWKELEERHGQDEFDAGPLSLRPDEFGPAVETPPEHAAVLMPVHLDLLSWTDPHPRFAPEVAPFLHGFREPDQDVSVLWRKDVDADDEILAQEALAFLPPMDGERIEVPVSAVRHWLGRQRLDRVLADVDVSAGAGTTGENSSDGKGGRIAWRWTPDGVEGVRSAAIAPGDVLIVPCAYGGLSASGVWSPDSAEPVEDIADELCGSVRGTPSSGGSDPGGALIRLGPTVLGAGADADGDPDDVAEAVAERILDFFPVARGDIAAYGPEGNRRWAIDRRPAARSHPPGGSDRANSFRGAEVLLREHLWGVGAVAEDFARHCGLPKETIDDLRLAGELHDLGKLDDRFQEELHGDRLAAAAAPEPLAKSAGPMRSHWVYPSGMRHEFLSAEMAATHQLLLQQAHDSDLVLHLITTHHGRARPLPLVVDDPSARQVRGMIGGTRITAGTDLPHRTVGAASVERFVALTRRYGWYGVAWLEAILRLADHRRSEAESRGGAGTSGESAAAGGGEPRWARL